MVFLALSNLSYLRLGGCQVILGDTKVIFGLSLR